MGRGIQGAVLRAFRATDYRLRVIERRDVTDRLVRLRMSAGGLFDDTRWYPTLWLRLWFADGSRLHQRGYTVVDAEPEADRFWLEFALHDGLAANWARRAEPGDEIEATLLGSRFTLPDPAPDEYVIVGDPASLPAINSLLDHIGTVPARVWLEWAHDSDRDLPVRAGRQHRVTWVRRADRGAALVAAVRDAAPEADSKSRYGWVACDSRTTRSLVGVLRSDFRIDRSAMTHRAYWVA